MPKASTFGALIASQVIDSDSVPLLTNAGDNKRVPISEFRDVVGLGWGLTISAARFPGIDVIEKIQAAIDYAGLIGAQRVSVPMSMIPYDSTSIVFNPAVQMMREGGDSSVYDLWAYGATPSAPPATVRASITAALAGIANAGAGQLFIPLGIYDLGTLDGGGADGFLFEIVTDGVAIVSPDCRFTANSINSIATVFRFTDCERIYCEGIVIDDAGADITLSWQGVNLFTWRSTVTPDNGVPFRNFRAVRCGVEHAVTFFTATGVTDTRRLEGIDLDNCWARRSYYGIVCQDQGDDLHAENFKFINGRRCYFAYGVDRHDVDLHIFEDVAPASVDARILVKRYERNTKDIRVRAAFYGSLDALTYCVKLEHQSDDAGGLIEDIDIDLHIDAWIGSASTCQPVGFYSYAADGTPELTTTTKRWDRITLRGSWGPAAFIGTTKPIDITVQQTTPGILRLGDDLGRPSVQNTPHYPGFVVKTAHDREFRTLAGNLTTQTIVIPCATLDSQGFVIIAKTYAHDGGSSSGNGIYREDALEGYVTPGTGLVVVNTNNLQTVNTGTPPGVVYTAVSNTIVVSFTGAGFTGAGCYARVALEYVSRAPSYASVP